MNISITKYLFFTILITLFIYSCEDYEKDIPESDIYIDIPDDGYEVDLNDTLEISPKITYDYDSEYSWELDGEIISTELDLELIPEELREYIYTFIVENSRGSDTMEITALSIYNNNFEDLTLEDDTFSVDELTATSFTSNQLEYEVNGTPTDTANFYGCVCSNLSGSDSSEDLNEIYGAYEISSDYDSEVYAIIKLNESLDPAKITTTDGENHLFSEIWVNNTYYLYDVINSGTDEYTEFGGDDGTDSDWFILTITGYSSDGSETGSVEFYLADYTANSSQDDYIITEWTEIDISSLGYISTLTLSLSSSDVDDEGIMLTPPYVCIDEIKITE